MNRTTLLLITLIGVIIVLAAACGGAEPTPTPIPTPTSTLVPTIPPPPAGLQISVVGNNREFDKDELTAKAGSEVTLTFKNVSTLEQHNWVLVRAGTKNAVAVRGLEWPGDDWVQPGDPDVIANTRLLDPGETGEVRFTAPEAPGAYVFVCSFPGHFVTMFGDFEVIP